jgi:beta-lactamase superfamily II metal-dependent hydrolase
LCATPPTSSQAPPTDRAVGVFLVDVGQGDATVVLPPEGEGGAIIFDCRDDHTLGALLRNWGVERISAVIASHLDIDHIAGLTGLLTSFGDRIDRVFLSTDRDVCSEARNAQTARALIARAVAGRQQGAWELIPNTRDPRAVLEGDGWSISLIAPEYAIALQRAMTGEWEDANEASAVLRVAVGNAAVLIGGDAPLVTWAGLAPEELRSAVFRVPHHGGALDHGGVPPEWNVARLYDAVAAETAVVSVGTGNRYAHPSPDWIEPAIVSPSKCRLCCTQVTDRCQPNIAADVEAFREHVVCSDVFAEPPWRHLTEKTSQVSARRAELPCAGTVVVRLSLDGDICVYPAPADHDKMVRKWLHPLCRTTTSP